MSRARSTGQRINTTTRRRKTLAILAAGTVIGVGTFSTLASWTDNEWVFGGADSGGETGVGTSSFNVWQNRATTPPAASGTGWDDQETNPGGALVFDINPSALSPGSVMYAPVALQTKAGSVAGTITLQPAVASTLPAHTAATNDTGGALFNALHYGVKVSNTSVSCNATSWAAAGAGSAGTTIVTDVTGLGTAITPGAQSLQANRGDVQYYCFRIELPAGSPSTLQGRTIYPAWRFAAVSS